MVDTIKTRSPLLLTAREIADSRIDDITEDRTYLSLIEAQHRKDMRAVLEWAVRFRRLERTERRLLWAFKAERDFDFSRGRAEGYAEAADFLEQALAGSGEEL